MAAEHKPIRAAVMTMSDLGARGEREDTSGDRIVEFVAALGAELVERVMIPDEREQIRGLFRCHNPCEPRRFERISFWSLMITECRYRRFAHQNLCRGHRSPRGYHFPAGIDHPNPALIVHVRELCHGEK